MPGREPLGLDEATRAAFAEPLGRFLRALHDAPLIDGLPHDPMGRADMAVRVPKTLEQLEPVEDAGLWRATDAVHRLFDTAHSLPPSETRSSSTATCTSATCSSTTAATPSGVIDWGDMSCGDPAIDLSLVFSLVPAAAHAEFLAAYGPVRDDQLVRARVLAINLCSVLLLYGHTEGMREVEREALAALERAAAI